MNVSLRKTAARSIIGLTLAASGLATAGLLAPAAHAAPSPPTISATYGYRGVHVTGSGFTYGGTVYVEVDNAYTGLSSGYTITSASIVTICRPGQCYVVDGGAIPASGSYLFVPVDCGTYASAPVWVHAYDYGTGQWSNWVRTGYTCIA